MSIGEQSPLQELPSFELSTDGVSAVIEGLMGEFALLDERVALLERVRSVPNHSFADGMAAAMSVDSQTNGIKKVTEALDSVIPLDSHRFWFEELSLRYQQSKVGQEQPAL